MSRLIDADALRAAVMEILNNSIGDAYDGVYQCLEAINNAPTVDTDIVPLMQDIVANIPEIVDKAVNLYIEERRREND